MSHSSPVRPAKVIALRQVRTHNLKGIDLDLPLGRMIVITGVSGAGKSSLAFDTLYAEGQRRYVETFSAYARQFLEPLEKPDAEWIEGLPPAIAVSGRDARTSTLATVGAMTEVQEFLGLLFARAGRILCRTCGEQVEPATPQGIAREIESLPEGTRYEIAFPLEILSSSDITGLGRMLREDGLTRLRIDGKRIDLTMEELDAAFPAPPDSSSPVIAHVILDRLVRGRDALDRRLDSIETAFSRGLGRCLVITPGTVQNYIRGWRCSRCQTDHIEPQPGLFRASSPLGACPLCEGLGRIAKPDLDRIVPDTSKSIQGGAIAPWALPGARGALEDFIQRAPKLGVPVDVPFRSLSQEQVQSLMKSGPLAGMLGLEESLSRVDRASRPAPEKDNDAASRWMRSCTCPACHGTRLRAEALSVRIDQTNIAEISAQSIRDARDRIAHWLELPLATSMISVIGQVLNRLDYLREIGLDYLTLDRPVRTLSGGELRRVAMARSLGSGLVNTLYVLDEPTIGLHPREVASLLGVLIRLRNAGNTLVVVEHEHEVIHAADHIIDLGPGAGEAGGQVVYSGPVRGFDEVNGSITGDFLAGRKRIEVPQSRRVPKKGTLKLQGACGHNLRSMDVEFPLGVICVVCGISGSGKSTLVEETLFPAMRNTLTRVLLPVAPYRELSGMDEIGEVVLLDQGPLGRTGRSNPITYLKAFDEIRRTFASTHEARLRNYGAGMFSFNVEGGRCGNCKGEGYIAIDMQFLPDVMMPCPDCRGTRYRPEVLEISYRGRNIAEVLDLTAREAFIFFRHRPKIQARLRPLLEIGLDYLRLGQPAATLSGGEAQRLRLASFLATSMSTINRAATGPHTLFLLDEPTAGLHPFDMLKLIECMNSLVDRGNSVIIVEHSPEVMICADWIIELGPGAGENGGRVVAIGTPEQVAASGTVTAQVLGRFLAAHPGL